MTPARMQMRRTRGFNLQRESIALNGLPAVRVARPSRWGNPYLVSVYGRELALKLFANTVRGVWDPSLLDGHDDGLVVTTYNLHARFRDRLGQHPTEAARSELGGHNLACYCAPDVACHVDVLLAAANS